MILTPVQVIILTVGVVLIMESGGFYIYRWWYRRTMPELRWELERYNAQYSENDTGDAYSEQRYEINLSKNGKHILATDSRIRSYDTDHIKSIVVLLKSQFPPEDGYRISITGFKHVSSTSIPIEMQKLLVGYGTKQNCQICNNPCDEFALELCRPCGKKSCPKCLASHGCFVEAELVGEESDIVDVPAGIS